MSTHAIGTKGRIRPTAVGIVIASAVAVSALTAEARSVWSGSAKVTRPAEVRMDPYASKDDWIHHLGEAGGSKLSRHPSLRELEAKKSGL